MQLKLDGRNRHFKEALQGSTARKHCKEALQGSTARKHCLQRRTETTTTTFRTFSNWMAKIRAESLLRRPLRGISTCLTAATVRSTSTTELPTRKIASPQSYTEAKLHGIDPQPVCKRPVPEAAADSARNAAGYSVLEDRLVRLGDDRTDREDRPRGPTERAVTRGGGIGGSPWKYPRRRRFRF